MTITDIKKPKTCHWISDKNWELLSMKERDFVIFVHDRKFTKEKIMRKLYLKDRISFWRIQKKVREKIKDDVAKYNEFIEKNLKKIKNR